MPSKLEVQLRYTTTSVGVRAHHYHTSNGSIGRDPSQLVVYNWGVPINYKAMDDVDHWRVILDRLDPNTITWRPYMAIASWPEDPKHIPYMITIGYIIGR